MFLKKYKEADDGLQVRIFSDEKDAFGGNLTEGDQRIKGGFYPEKNTVVLIAGSFKSTQDVLGTLQ